ncbi:MAG: Asp-tRNA(Asn)/Glu-tRNA(Gln) amidotransferase subunit GatA [Betaproteobacteria bacterium]|nr:Asp-tRNA(Asn)/Glu-tRNA(Gln) amidotransferase subunit GatA [Betaproteobacteria bacterium]
MNLSYASLKSLRAALDSKQVSSVELAEHFLARAEDALSLNAFLHIDRGLTLSQARAADARIAKGEAGALTGIPMAHKDIFVTRSWRSTAGSKMLADYVSPFDATVVEKLNHGAGMVCLGKLNCDEFAMGSSNENSAFGAVKNPWDTSRIPGGSSGGSAAAVAAGLTPAATGTDTGGSLRQPAAMCGISAIKPTYGRVSRYGMIAFASSLDQGGPMARGAEDCALLLDAMAGFDERDSTSLNNKQAATPILARFSEAYASNASTGAPLQGVRIGVPQEFFGEGLSADVRAAVEAAIGEFEKLGATRVEISLPRTRLSIPAYYVIAPAEASSNLSRFDGVRYGHRAKEYRDLKDMIERSRAEGFGAEPKRRILTGAWVLSHGYYDAYYLQAQRVRRLIAQDFQEAFKSCDFIMGPVAPTTAWKIGEKNNDPVAMYLEDIFTLGVSLAGLPGMSVPCGFGADKMPVGLQIIGNYFDEGRMLAAAHQYQQVTDWHARTPEAFR